MDEVVARARGDAAAGTCRPTAVAPWPTSTTPGSPRPTPLGRRGAGDVRRRRTGSTPRPSRACCRWRATSSASARRLLDAPDGFVGSVTSGGTESILLAVQTARDARPDVERPLDGPARPRPTPPSTRRRTTSASSRSSSPSTRPPSAPTPDAMAAAIDDRTVLVVASAPSYAHGVVDPVAGDRRGGAARRACAATSTPASAAGCCPTSRGSASRCRRGPSRSRASPASRSTCTSTPTPPRASRSCCTGRPSCAGRSSSPRPTGPATRCSTRRRSRPVGRTARGRLGRRRRIVGDDGYLALAEQVRDGMRELVAGLAEVRAALGRRGARLDAPRPARRRRPRRLHDLRRDARRAGGSSSRRWPSPTTRRPCTSPSARPPRRSSPSSSARSAESVAAARAAGPVGVPPSWRRQRQRSTRRPSTRRPSTGCSRWPGSPGADGELALPERMAPVNALLDVAPPALREALLVAFLDRLSR